MEYLKSLANVDIQEVPYKSAAQALTDVIGGQVMMNLPNIAAALPHIRAGRLKALAVTTSSRSAVAPEIPAMAESAGLPTYAAAHWQGLIAPAGTPPEVIARLNAELNRALQMPDVKDRLVKLGVDVVPSTPEQIAAEVRDDVAKWSQLIKSINLSLD
jgi:tripartite-type tricarboxylate transporter receptor subunit TctC